MKQTVKPQSILLFVVLLLGYPLIAVGADSLKPVFTPSEGPIIYNHRSDQKVGAKGEFKYDLSTEPAACGESVKVFDHAKIVFMQRRFGEAQIVSTPTPGCMQCAPLIVRWYHEPTGYLDYQIQIYLQQVIATCED